MKKSTGYVAHKPDKNGLIHYSDEEHETWKLLFDRQIAVIQGRACEEFMDGLTALKLSAERIPQLGEVNGVLTRMTGWSVARVPALISFNRFFELLANRQFPVATFIRSRQELDYLTEPDIFHEIFGHCPLLTNRDFASLTEIYGQLGLAASKEDRVFLARLYWMTIEFGLLRSGSELKIYGGGILSSYKETIYALDSNKPIRKGFNVVDVLRTPYRIDILQPIYFIIDQLSDLHQVTQLDLMSLIQDAKRLGLFDPLYPSKDRE